MTWLALQKEMLRFVNVSVNGDSILRNMKN